MLDRSNLSSAPPTDDRTRPTPRRRSSPVGLTVVLSTVLTGCVGGVIGVRQPGLLLVAVAAVLIGVAVVGVILAVGFIGVITMLAAEGRRRARSVEDVRSLIAGTAGAYGTVFARFTALVRGTSPPRPDDEEPDPCPPPSVPR